MRDLNTRLLGRLVKEDRGQTMVVVIITLFVIMGLSAAGIETGHVYYAYRLLQASTNAATLAAAQAMPNIGTSSDSMTAGTAWGTLKAYSSIPGGYNVSSMLTETSSSISATFDCSSSISTTLNVGCQAPIGTGSSCGGSLTSCNSIAVMQTAQVNLWFGGLLGLRSMNLKTVAYGAMRGGSDIPYNIAVIVDTTSSMNDAAPSGDGCGSGASQIQCAVAGLKKMLAIMDPCPLNEVCPGNATYVDGVALFVFPAVTLAQNSKNQAIGPLDDTSCPTKNPPIVPYSFINVTSGSNQNLLMGTSPTTYPDTAGTYEVQTFEDSYRQNDLSTTGLNSGDALAATVGVGSTGCDGLEAPGGDGTYYAQAIYAAQAALAAQQGSYPGSQNVLIILSDGDATACNSQANSAAGGNTCTASQIVAVNCPAVSSSVVKGKTVVTCGSTTVADGSTAVTLSCPSGGCTGNPLNGTGNSTTNPASTDSSGNAIGYQAPTYPSALGECGQAVQAAQAATAAGTRVYTVAMGSATSGGCATDASYTITSGSTYGAQGYPAGTHSGQPCNAIAAMASTANTFYSDNTAGCVALVNNQPQFTTIGGIFQAIASSLTNSRLIPPTAY